MRKGVKEALWKGNPNPLTSKSGTSISQMREKKTGKIGSQSTICIAVWMNPMRESQNTVALPSNFPKTSVLPRTNSMIGLIESHSAKTNQHPYDAILEDKYVGESSLDEGRLIFSSCFFWKGFSIFPKSRSWLFYLKGEDRDLFVVLMISLFPL